MRMPPNDDRPQTGRGREGLSLLKVECLPASSGQLGCPATQALPAHLGTGACRAPPCHDRGTRRYAIMQATQGEGVSSLWPARPAGLNACHVTRPACQGLLPSSHAAGSRPAAFSLFPLFFPSSSSPSFILSSSQSCCQPFSFSQFQEFHQATHLESYYSKVGCWAGKAGWEEGKVGREGAKKVCKMVGKWVCGMAYTGRWQAGGKSR